MAKAYYFCAIWKLLFAQGVVVVFVTSAVLGFISIQAAQSAFFGGLIGFLPNAYFSYKISRTRGMAAQQILRSFYAGETVKLLSTAALFVLVFQLPGILFAPLFSAFVAVTSVFWFALLMQSTQLKRD